MPSFGRFILTRVIRAALTIWLVVSAVFIILRLSGDPVALLLSEDATPAQIAALRSHLGLDAPIVVQYARYWGNLFRGDLGDSLRQRQPALGLVFDRMPATLQLAAAAFVLAAIVGFGIGTMAALTRGTIWDRAAMALISILQAGPVFFVGIILILFFSVRLGWLPSSGRGDLKNLILPAVTLSGFTMASLARLVRSALLDVLRLDYIRTARAKGISEARVVLRHALRNALVAVVALFGLDIGALIGGGTLLTEVVFGLRGIGKLTYDALQNLDLPVVMATVLYASLFVVLANAAVDAAQAALDPRQR